MRVWVRRIQPTVREQADLHRRLGSYPAYLSTPRRPSSHPRGFRLIHLSKSCVTKVLRQQPLRVRRRTTFLGRRPQSRSLPIRLPSQGRRNLIVRSALVNRTQRRFLCNLRETQMTRSDLAVSPRRYSHADANQRFAASLVLFKSCCVKQQATRNRQTPQFNHRGRFRVVGRSEHPTNSAGGQYTRPPSLVKRQVRASDRPSTLRRHQEYADRTAWFGRKKARVMDAPLSAALRAATPPPHRGFSMRTITSTRRAERAGDTPRACPALPA